MQLALSLSQEVGAQKACHALEVARASFYRWGSPCRMGAQEKVRPVPSWALTGEERQGVLEVLDADRFVDQSPREIYATLLDERTYLCSVRTLYRILEEHGEVRERRNQLHHPVYTKPELLATGPNQILPNSKDRLNGRIITSMFFWTFSADM
jgi:putative transposase